jgi:pyridoxal biosynthesis lyase PdxS
MDKIVLIEIVNFEQAKMAKKNNIYGLVILYNDILNMSRIKLAIKTKQELKMYCIVQVKSQLEINILQNIVDGFDCIDKSLNNTINRSYYDYKFIEEVDSLKNCLDNFEENILLKTKKYQTIDELKKCYTNIYTKIKEFHRYRNVNSINKFCKEMQVSKNEIYNCIDNNKISKNLLAHGVIKNGLDAVSVIKIGYDGLILCNSIYDIDDCSDKLMEIVECVKFFYDMSKIKKIIIHI